MKSRENILNLFPVLVLIVALLTVSSVKGLDVSQKVRHEKNKSTKAENSRTHEAEINNGCFEAVIPFVQVDLSQDLYLIYVKTFLNCLYVDFDFKETLYISKYFKNLFLFVISVNAP